MKKQITIVLILSLNTGHIKIIDPLLVQKLFKLLYDPKLTKNIYYLLGLAKAPGYKKEFIKLLFKNHLQLEENIKNHISHFARNANLTIKQIKQLGSWLLDLEITKNNAEWISGLLANSLSTDYEIICEYFEKYLENFEQDLKNDNARTAYTYLCLHGSKNHSEYIKYAFNQCLKLYTEEHRNYGIEKIIMGYARIEKSNAIDQLKEIYNIHNHCVIPALGIAAEGSKNLKLAKWMIKNYQNSVWYGDTKHLYNLTYSIQQITGKTGFQLTEHLYSEEQKEGFHPYISSKSLSNETIIERLRTLGFINSQVTNQKLLNGIEDDIFFNIESRVIHLLEKNDLIVHYDSESGVLPIDYKSIINLFANKSKGYFQPWKVSQKNSKDKVNSVEFSFGKNRYTFSPYDNENWIDCSIIIAAINTSILESGSENYFIEIPTGGQDAMYIYSTPKLVLKLKTEFNVDIQPKTQTYTK